MTIKIRNLTKVFSPTHQTTYKNLLVSGCSFTFNNSEVNICTWPYYLADLAQFETVYDLSQIAAGNNHIFNSVIYEIEANNNITPENTLIIVMWSGLTRTDVIVEQGQRNEMHYRFDKRFSTLNIYNDPKNTNPVDELSFLYKKIVSPDSQILESLIKIKALQGYLEFRNFRYVFLSWMDPAPELSRIQTPLTMIIDNIPYLYEFVQQRNMLIPNDGHPSPDGHLLWTRNCLIPGLSDRGLISPITL